LYRQSYREFIKDIESNPPEYLAERLREMGHRNIDEKDDNVKHAIQLRLTKDTKTDFYRKLQQLNDRIAVYKQLFMNKIPKFLQSNY
jgi:hypothetical protein